MSALEDAYLAIRKFGDDGNYIWPVCRHPSSIIYHLRSWARLLSLLHSHISLARWPWGSLPHPSPIPPPIPLSLLQTKWWDPCQNTPENGVCSLCNPDDEKCSESAEIKTCQRSPQSVSDQATNTVGTGVAPKLECRSLCQSDHCGDHGKCFAAVAAWDRIQDVLVDALEVITAKVPVKMHALCRYFVEATTVCGCVS